MNEAMYHQEKWSRDVMIPSLYMHYYSVVLNTRQDWIGNRRRDGMRWFAYNGQEDRICNQVLRERRCQEVSSSVWRWHERFCAILLLDEATSALDSENQEKFLTALKTWRENHPCTVVTVAHRLSTIVDSDIIYVVHDGVTAVQGTHKELLKSCEYYGNMVCG